MGQRGSKHQDVQTMTASFSGGLNLHDSAINIQDNQLRDARNFYYADRGAALVTRPGIKPVLDAPMGKASLTVMVYPIGTGGWRFTGETSWRSSGDSLVLSFGTYSIEFMTVNGFTPATKSVALVRNSTVNGFYPVTKYLESVNDAANFSISTSGALSLDIGANSLVFGNFPSYSNSNYALLSFKLGIPQGSNIDEFVIGANFIGWYMYSTYGIKVGAPSFDPRVGTDLEFKQLYESITDYKTFSGTSIVPYYTSVDISDLVQNIVSSQSYAEEDYITIFLYGNVWENASCTITNSTSTTYIKYSYY